MSLVCRKCRSPNVLVSGTLYECVAGGDKSKVADMFHCQDCGCRFGCEVNGPVVIFSNGDPDAARAEALKLLKKGPEQ